MIDLWEGKAMSNVTCQNDLPTADQPNAETEPTDYTFSTSFSYGLNTQKLFFRFQQNFSD